MEQRFGRVVSVCVWIDSWVELGQSTGADISCSCLFKSKAMLFTGNQSSISSQSPHTVLTPTFIVFTPKSAPDSQFTPCKKARFCPFIIRETNSVKLLSDKCGDSSVAAC